MATGKRKSELASIWVATTDLPVSPSHPSYARLNAILRLEREYLTQALADHGGNVSRAARALGIHRSSL